MPKKPSKDFTILEEATVPLDGLVEDDENPQTHDEDNLAQIRMSLETYGQPTRLVVRKSDAKVFDGNGRVEVMRRLAWTDVRVQYVEGSDELCRAYSIAANRTAKTSRFDDKVLAEHLKHLADEGLLDAATYTDPDLQALLDDLKPVDVKEVDPDKLLPRGEGGHLARCPNCSTEFRVGGNPDD